MGWWGAPQKAITWVVAVVGGECQYLQSGHRVSKSANYDVSQYVSKYVSEVAVVGGECQYLHTHTTYLHTHNTHACYCAGAWMIYVYCGQEAVPVPYLRHTYAPALDDVLAQRRVLHFTELSIGLYAVILTY